MLNRRPSRILFIVAVAVVLARLSAAPIFAQEAGDPPTSEPAPASAASANDDAAANAALAGSTDVKDAIAADKDALLVDCEATDEESGQPVAGVIVYITFDIYSEGADQAERDELYKHRLHTKTDAKGHFQVPLTTWSQSREKLHVRVEMDHARYLRYWDSRSIQDIVQKKPNGQRSWFQQARLTEAREIVGRVVDPDGNPVPDVMLYKQYTKEQFVFDSKQRDIRDNDSPRTDANGQFRCKVAARGYVAIRYRSNPEFVERPIEVSAERDQRDIQLSRGGRFTGQVLTSEGKPFAGAYVSVRPDGKTSAPNTDCDADGHFTTEAFGRGKHTVTVRWNGPPGSPQAFFVRPTPELYLPVTIELTGDEERHEILFRPIDHFECIARLASAPKPNDDPKRAALIFPLVLPVIQARGLFQGQPWKGGELDMTGDFKTAQVLVPQGLTDVELSFGDIPQRVQLNNEAPLLFGGAMKIASLSANLTDIRLHRYEPTTVTLHVDTTPLPQDLKVAAVYARKAEMRAAGMVFATPEAAMTKKVDGANITFSILPDEMVRFVVSAPGYQPVLENVQLREGESKTLSIKLAR